MTTSSATEGPFSPRDRATRDRPDQGQATPATAHSTPAARLEPEMAEANLRRRVREHIREPATKGGCFPQHR